MTKKINDIIDEVRITALEVFGTNSSVMISNGKESFNMKENCLVVAFAQNEAKTKIYMAESYSEKEMLEEGFVSELCNTIKRMKGRVIKFSNTLIDNGELLVSPEFVVLDEINIEDQKAGLRYFGYLDTCNDDIGIITVSKNDTTSYESATIVEDINLIVGMDTGVLPDTRSISIDASRRFFRAAAPYMKELIETVEKHDYEDVCDVDDLIDEIVIKIVKGSHEIIPFYEKEVDLIEKLTLVTSEFISLIDSDVYGFSDIQFINNDNILFQMDDDEYWEEDYNYEHFVVSTPTIKLVKDLAKEDKLTYKQMHDFVNEILEAFKENEINE